MRVVEKDGEPWFVAKDVAEVLGYSNTRDAINRHCKAAISDGVAFPDAIGRSQKYAIIPERDIYRLVLKSNLPAAEKFEEWVVAEIPIWDGRNRYKACREAGVPVRVREWSGEGSLVGFVVSLNVNRRQLTPSQKGAVSLEVLPMLEAEAKERQREAGQKYGEKHPQEVLPPVGEALKPQPPQPRSVDVAAQILGVSHGNISEMKRIERVAPELMCDSSEPVPASYCRTESPAQPHWPSQRGRGWSTQASSSWFGLTRQTLKSLEGSDLKSHPL